MSTSELAVLSMLSIFEPYGPSSLPHPELLTSGLPHYWSPHSQLVGSLLLPVLEPPASVLPSLPVPKSARGPLPVLSLSSVLPSMLTSTGSSSLPLLSSSLDLQSGPLCNPISITTGHQPGLPRVSIFATAHNLTQPLEGPRLLPLGLLPWVSLLPWNSSYLVVCPFCSYDSDLLCPSCVSSPPHFVLPL